MNVLMMSSSLEEMAECEKMISNETASLAHKRLSILLEVFAVVTFVFFWLYALGCIVFWLGVAWWWKMLCITAMTGVSGMLWWPKTHKLVQRCCPCVWWRRGIAVGVVVIVITLHALRSAGVGDWIPHQKRVASVSVEGGKVKVSNFRFARSKDKIDWSVRSFRLEDIVGVDLVVQKFGKWRGSAHAMCCFRLANGESIAVSVESRRESYKFSPVGGMFKYYQLIVIFGDERDLLWSRIAEKGESPLMIYPLEVKADQAQSYFLRLAERANELATTPEFYNVLGKNCITTLVNASPHLRVQLEGDWRFCFPGFSNELFYELGFIKGRADELMEIYAVQENIAAPNFEDEGVEWSAMIRRKK